MRENIVLIGFMGSGKTTVGRDLAGRLGYRLLDTDEAIEEREGRPVRSIFDEEGEEAFRQMETRLLEELREGMSRTVLSTGGGLPLRPENGAILKGLGMVAYLRASLETVLLRLRGDTSRPLLLGEDGPARAERLLRYRDPIYEYTAHLLVETDGRDVGDISGEILRNYEILRRPRGKNS